MASPGSQVQARMTKLAAEIERAQVVAVRRAALRTKQVIVAGSPARLRNVGRKGRALTVRYDVARTPQGARGEVKALGPWPLIEENTRAHQIVGKKRGRGGRRGPVVIPGVGPRASVQHPGTKGKHPFAKGVGRAEPQARRILESAMRDAIRRGAT